MIKIAYSYLISMLLILVSMTGCKDKSIDIIQPTFETLEVTNISYSSAFSGVNISSHGNDLLISFGICWDTDSNPLFTDNSSSNNTFSKKYVCVMSNLKPETTYYVRSYIRLLNETIYGNEICFTTNKAPSVNSFTDPRDSNVYYYDTIGSQVWMLENLRYLPSVIEPSTGSKSRPYYYVYSYYGTSVEAAKLTAFTYSIGEFNFMTNGALYNFPAAKISCPKGWHLPSDEEWLQLINYLGGKSEAGRKFRSSIFKALPSGYRSENQFKDISLTAMWWSSSEFDYWKAGQWYVNFSTSDNSPVYYFQTEDNYALSVRCVKD